MPSGPASEFRGLYRSPNVLSVCPPVSLPRDLDATVAPVTGIGTAQDDIEPREGYPHSKVTQLEARTLPWSRAPTTLCTRHLVGDVSDRVTQNHQPCHTWIPDGAELWFLLIILGEREVTFPGPGMRRGPYVTWMGRTMRCCLRFLPPPPLRFVCVSLVPWGQLGAPQGLLGGGRGFLPPEPPLVPQAPHSWPLLALQESRLRWGLPSTQECHIPSFLP
jgi:hypothetical protein